MCGAVNKTDSGVIAELDEVPLFNPLAELI